MQLVTNHANVYSLWVHITQVLHLDNSTSDARATILAAMLLAAFSIWTSSVTSIATTAS